MKKLTLFFTVLILAMVSAACVVLIACNSGEKFEYTVTVIGEDEVTGVSDVTVKWSNGGVKASAKTDGNGKATASIAAANYKVTLDNLPEGLTYDPPTVTSQSRGISIYLARATVEYSVTVKKSDNTPASGVTVNWRKANNASAAQATTDGAGKASTNLSYGDYSITLSNLPAETYYLGIKTVSGAQPDATFDLLSGTTANFSVNVKSEGGLKFKNYTVTAYSGEQVAASAETNEDGTATVTLPVGASYTVRVENVPEGYTYTTATISTQTPEANIILSSKPIETEPASDARYLIGDIIHDYEFTTPYEVDGKAVDYKISEILKTKKAIVLNFWGTNCSACMMEMPAMQQAYELYSDEVEMLAVSNYMGGDSNTVIENFRSDNEYTFPMFRDTHSFTTKFALTGWPTNVIIDRYGAIARIEDGALTSFSLWQKLLDQYVSDDYVQKFIPGLDRNDSTLVEMAKPDVTVEKDHYEKVAAAINNSSAIPGGCSISWFGEPEATAEFTWPFMLKTLEGSTVLYPSNTDHDSTFSFIYADITMKPGKVFAFDYWSQTEAGADIFYVLFDGKTAYTISGENDGWKTCYVYVDIIDGSHQLALTYIKDESRGAGFDNVYIKNARFVEISAITESTDMLRGAAYGVPPEGASGFPHYATVEKQSDGYYYVNLSALSGSQYAGNDNHPMLFANFIDATNWNKKSIEDILNEEDGTNGDYKYDCYFEYDGKTDDWRELLLDYVSLAGKSDVKGYLPVDDDLRGLLEAFVSHISKDGHENEWLEVCYFFSHYGSGKPIGNPIIGLTEKTAIEITAGQTYTADLTRIIAPYPIAKYHFTPDKSGVYKIESLIGESKMSASQIWVYTEDIDHCIVYDGDERFNRDAENEQNFVLHLYLTEGRKYYIAVAFLMTETGTFDFRVSYEGESAKVLSVCASGDYTDLDEDGQLELRYAVKYGKDKDGYYHVLNSDDTLGDFIYIDFKYSTIGYPYAPLSDVIDMYFIDPLDLTTKLFKVFDFTKYISYYPIYDDDGELVAYNYGIIDLSESGYLWVKDYTNDMKKFCTEAMKNDGLLKVNDKLVDILTLYYRLRTDMIENEEIPAATVPGEWLQFCWYNKTIDENNPV